MKLFTRYNRINITFTILVFLIGSVAFYFVLQYVLIRQLDDTIRAEQQEVVNFAKTHNQLPEIQNTKHQWITIVATKQAMPKSNIYSTLVYNKAEDENEWVRHLTFTLTINKEVYLITVNKSETETEDLLKLIILVTVGMVGFILISNYIINRRLVNRLWKPFYTTIEQIKKYQLALQAPLKLSSEKIDEINLLNESLNQMTRLIHQDYHALRSFTENASHEMQTPLAIIRSKVESLLQDAEGNKETIQQLLVIEDATLRLSKLHQSLLLLTRLENSQFHLTEQVNIGKIIETKTAERKDLIDTKKLNLQLACDQVTLSFHTHLAEILISNLLNNAIRYTPEGGQLSIELTEKYLVFSNTAVNGPLDSEKVFTRFYKDEQVSEGTGLGLAIIQQICQLAHYSINYRYHSNNHIFTLQFIA